MKYTQLPLGPLQTNCYILENDKKECILFDPGEEGEKLVRWIKGKDLKPLAVLLTHAHFDHIGAVDIVRDTFEVPVYLHQKEADWLASPSLNGSAAFMMGPVSQRQADFLIKGETPIEIGDFSFDVFETPGHSPGSVSYYSKQEGYLFSGDVLFKGSVGRTDLRGGSMDILMSSIREKLLPLPELTIVMPGHGEITLIAEEMENNPYLR